MLVLFQGVENLVVSSFWYMICFYENTLNCSLFWFIYCCLHFVWSIKQTLNSLKYLLFFSEIISWCCLNYSNCSACGLRFLYTFICNVYQMRIATNFHVCKWKQFTIPVSAQHKMTNRIGEWKWFIWSHCIRIVGVSAAYQNRKEWENVTPICTVWTK